MPTRFAIIMLPAAALTSMLLAVAPASAEERICRGSIGAVTLDNVRVPQGATCRLQGTRVQGTIKVERAATLVAAKVIVIGNVQGEGAKSVAIRNNSRVGGSVQVVQGGGAQVVNSTVDGSIQLESNRTALNVLNNTVGSDVQAFQNSGGVEISDNTIDGNLQCKSNNPPPTGSGNEVQGNKEDQCSSL